MEGLPCLVSARSAANLSIGELKRLRIRRVSYKGDVAKPGIARRHQKEDKASVETETRVHAHA